MISIVMPYYNGKEFVKETIDSILAQTFRDYELVIVNDGSPVEDQRLYIENLIKSYNDPRIKYILKTNGGLSDSRNVGIKSSTGEFIAFIDQDDLWEKTKLEKQIKIFSERKDVGFICTDGVHIGLKTGSMNHSKKRHIPESMLLQNTFSKMLRGNFVICSSVIFRRSLQEKVGWSDGGYKVIPDYEYFLRFAEKADFYFLTEELTKYRIHGANTSNNQIKVYAEVINVLSSKKLQGWNAKYAATNQFSKAVVRLCLLWIKKLF